MIISRWWCFARSISWLRWVSSASFLPQRLQKQPWLRLAPQSRYESGSCFWLASGARAKSSSLPRLLWQEVPSWITSAHILPGWDGESLLLQLTVGPRTSQRDVHVMLTVAFAGGETFFFLPCLHSVYIVSFIIRKHVSLLSWALSAAAQHANYVFWTISLLVHQ